MQDQLLPSTASLHLDEARENSLRTVRELLRGEQRVRYAAVVDDLFGRISIALWLAPGGSSTDEFVEALRRRLVSSCGPYWTGTVTCSDAAEPASDPDVFLRTVWTEGRPDVEIPRLSVNDRHRHHLGWFSGWPDSPPLWPADQGPPVLVFHGFKGGAGRTTLLASYALACASLGQHVLVLDMDLDAPGVGKLLAADSRGTTARWGVVDFLLEARHKLPLADYFHVAEHRVGPGRIEVVPAGQLDDAYLTKLARVELESRTTVAAQPLGQLLNRVKSELNPNVVLIDGRAGLSPAAGILLSGMAHLHVLVATTNSQSMLGLERVIRHLGYEQASRDIRQRDCVVVQAHVPETVAAAEIAKRYFSSHVERFFRDGYYAQTRTEDDRTWTIEDLDSEIAPHVPVPISYRVRLAHFERLDDVVGALIDDAEYKAFHSRINERLGKSRPTSDGVDDG